MSLDPAVGLILFAVAYAGLMAFLFNSNAPIYKRQAIWRLFGPAFKSIVEADGSRDEKLAHLSLWLQTTRRLVPRDARDVRDVTSLLEDAVWYGRTTNPKKFRKRFAIPFTDGMLWELCRMLEHARLKNPFLELLADQRQPILQLIESYPSSPQVKAEADRIAGQFSRINGEVRRAERRASIGIWIGAISVIFTFGFGLAQVLQQWLG